MDPGERRSAVQASSQQSSQVHTTFHDITGRRTAEGRLRALWMSMDEGVAIHEVIRDDHDTPVNYRLLERQPAIRADRRARCRRNHRQAGDGGVRDRLTAVSRGVCRRGQERTALPFRNLLPADGQAFFDLRRTDGKRPIRDDLLDVSNRKRRRQRGYSARSGFGWPSKGRATASGTGISEQTRPTTVRDGTPCSATRSIRSQPTPRVGHS